MTDKIPDDVIEAMAKAMRENLGIDEPVTATEIVFALAAAESKGWKLVPRKATKAMVNAAAKAMSPAHRPTPKRVSVAAKHAYRYRAMYDAAPKVSQ